MKIRTHCSNINGMYQKNNYIIILIIFLIASFILMPSILTGLAKALVLEKTTNSADIMIILGGGRGTRIEAATKKYKTGSYPRIIMSGGGKYFDTYYTELMSNYAIKLGIPKEKIIQEKHSLSTKADAEECKKIINTLDGINSILIITSKFHSKRAYKTFQKTFKNTGIKLYIATAPDGVDYNNWWKSHEQSQLILSEWAKTIVYWIKY